MTNNENKLYNLLKADDVIPHILSGIKDINERNDLSEFLKKRGVSGHKEMELTFAFYYMTAEAFKEFTRQQIDFLDELSTKTDSISDRVNSLSIVLDEQASKFDSDVKKSMDESVDNIVTYIKSLSAYVVELSEKQDLTKEDVNNKLRESINEQIKPIFSAFKDVQAAKTEELESEIDKLVLACLSKRLQKGESSKVMELSKKIEELIKQSKNAASFTTAQLIGLLFGTGLVGSIFTGILLKFMH